MTRFTLSFDLWMAGLRGTLQYRTDTFIVIVMALAFQGTGFAFIWVVLSRFGSLAGWTLGQVAFLYGLRLIVHAVAGVLTGPFFGLEQQVRTGEFDRYLVRPLSPLLQFMTQRVEISIFGDLLGGIAIFVVADQLVGLAWTPLAFAYLVLAIAGGALVEGATRILIGALSFRFLASQSLLFLGDSVFSTFANYPLTIFGGILRFLFTFAFPLAFVAYIPASVLLGRTAELQVEPLLAYLAPVVGIIWIAASVRVFDRELRNYQSAGH
ncbi:MAG: ABC-2 family transporter protein [Chloroflexi bacterium]|nr:ABC-2 family transporter protein [Chloroflexota bacterium]